MMIIYKDRDNLCVSVSVSICFMSSSVGQPISIEKFDSFCFSVTTVDIDYFNNNI
jgi:hypothetical protein